jgi:hypothetical protein
MSATMKLSPAAPTHAASSPSGLSDWANARRPHEKPPYGQTAAMPSRAVQMPASITGMPPRRQAAWLETVSPHRQAREMSTAPAAKNSVSTPARASHGTGPR